MGLIPTSGFRFQSHMCSWVALRHSSWVLGSYSSRWKQPRPMSNSPATSRLCGRMGAEGSSPLREPMSAAIVWGTAPWPGHWSYKATLHRVGPGVMATPSFPPGRQCWDAVHSSGSPWLCWSPSLSWGTCLAAGWGGHSGLPGAGWSESRARKGLWEKLKPPLCWAGGGGGG